MSHAAFLNTIREHPDANLPRLVFADWLEEAGDAARAEFIRVQCELASLPEHVPQRRPLEDREHDLLSEHEPAWAGEVPRSATEWEWRRGFIDEATLDIGDRIGWDSIVADHPVAGLSLSYPPPRPYTGLPLQECWDQHLLSQIRRLDFTPLGLNVAQVVAELLTTLPEPALLTDLNLAGVFPLSWLADLLARSPRTPRLTGLAASSLATPQRFAAGEDRLDLDSFHSAVEEVRLQSLSLHDSGLSGDDLRSLLGSGWSESLTHLDVSGNPLAADAYTAFGYFRPGMLLKSLDVSSTPLAGISLEPLLDTRALETVTKLEMNGCGSARRNMEVLSRSRYWTQATELRAHSGTIPASTLDPLCGSSGPPALRLLDLADNYLRTEGVRLLCDAPWSEPLTWLALSRNYLDDDSLRALANSRLRHLRTLHLSHNNLRQDRSDGELVTDIGVSWLTDSPTLANLRLLTLNHTGISDRSVELALKRAHWRLFGLGIAGNDLTGETVRVLATSPRLSRLVWLDISGNPRLGGRELMPLAESPYLSRLCELDCGGIGMAEEVRVAFRERLGPRFSH